MIVLAGCAKDVTDSSEYLAVRAEADRAAAAAEEARAEADSAADKLAELERSVDDAERSAADQADEVARLTDALAQSEQQQDDGAGLRRDYVALVSESIGFLGVTPKDATCIAEAVADDADARDAFTIGSTFGDVMSDSDTATLTAVFAACDQDLDELLSAGVLTGQAYGDNPELDALYDACGAGDGVACDDLYVRSEVGSEYERYARTCGDRFTETDAPLYCADQGLVFIDPLPAP